MTSGEVRYLQIPAEDPERSAAFYASVFGWEIRRRADGAIAFDDGSGHVSGMWVTGHPPASDPGLIVWIRVANVGAALAAVEVHGGEVVMPLTPQKPVEAIATFRDPAGNVLGVFHEGGG
jgi:predicted enzyme related to lactoylglutathione lyase